LAATSTNPQQTQNPLLIFVAQLLLIEVVQQAHGNKNGDNGVSALCVSDEQRTERPSILSLESGLARTLISFFLIF